MAEGDKRRHGYSRDKRPDCPQVVIALVVTTDGLPLAYEVLPGNTADCTTLRMFLARIERQCDRARRVWVMDRGIPTEAVLAEMRGSDPPVQYLVGTPKGRLSRLEKQLLTKPWQKARAGVQVKLLAEDDELYVYAESVDRASKERAMRSRQLKWLWKRLRELAAMEIPREEMLMKLGAARSRAPTAWRLVDIEMDKESSMFVYTLNRQKLRRIRRREGRYLLRTNLTENDPALLWQYYTQLVAVEEAFKNLKGDLAIRPVFHQEERRIEAHIFIAFLAYCLQITLQRRLHALAPGLTARSALEKVCRRPDDRCSSADDRRAGAAADPLHPAGAGTQAPDPAAQAPIATTATTPHRHRLRHSPPAVVQTFPANSLIGNGCRTEKPANPRRRANGQYLTISLWSQ